MAGLPSAGALIPPLETGMVAEMGTMAVMGEMVVGETDEGIDQKAETIAVSVCAS